MNARRIAYRSAAGLVFGFGTILAWSIWSSFETGEALVRAEAWADEKQRDRFGGGHA